MIARIRELSARRMDNDAAVRRYSDDAVAFVLNSEGARTKQRKYWGASAVARVRRDDVYRRALTAGADGTATADALDEDEDLRESVSRRRL